MHLFKGILIIFAILTLCAFYTKSKSTTVEQFILDNGMQVIVIPNTKIAAVSHMVWYRAGAIDEPVGKGGVAHFLEHLMFKGTAQFPDGDFSKQVARIGGNDNAFTSYDYTAYYQNVSNEKLELVMQMEADRMQNLIITDAEVNKERDVVLEERNSRTDNVPRSLLKEQMRAALYVNHPYGRPLIGWRHEIEGLTTEDARRWYDTYYAPNNAILIVSGDVLAKELKPLAKKYYGKIPKVDLPSRVRIKEPDYAVKHYVKHYDEKVQKPEWMRYYMAPSQNYGDKIHCYPLILLSHILGGSNTSRLYQQLVVKEELVASVGSAYDDLALGPASFAFYALPSEGVGLSEVESKIELEIDKIINDGVTKEELQRAKKSLIADAIYAKEDLKTLAYVYGQAVATDAGIDYVDNWPKNIEAVLAEDIRLAARAVLSHSSSVTGHLLQGK